MVVFTDSNAYFGKIKIRYWDQIIKKTSSEEAPPTFTPLFPPIERPSTLLFPSNSLGEKRSFDKAFNLNYWLLADDYIREEVDLSFVYCQSPPTMKAKRSW